MRINVCDSIRVYATLGATLTLPCTHSNYMHTMFFLPWLSLKMGSENETAKMGNINLITYKLLDSFQRITRLVSFCQQTRVLPPLIVKFSARTISKRKAFHGFQRLFPFGLCFHIEQSLFLSSTSTAIPQQGVSTWDPTQNVLPLSDVDG